MVRSVTSLVVLASIAAFAQPPEAPAFEVASIKVSQAGREVIEPLPTSLTMRNVRLIDCIAWTYGVPSYRISGPPWLNDTWLEVWAKTPNAAKEAELRSMLRRLLEDRLQLSAHRQSKEIPTLILTVGKNGHKLKAAAGEESSFKTGKLTLTGQGATVAQLAEFLARQIKIPVIDQTGLTGRFDYTLDVNAYVTEEMLKSSGSEPPAEASSIVAGALQAQLGLKLDSKKASVEMVVVDRVEKTPTEN